jgi:phosphoheptose isomerase
LHFGNLADFYDFLAGNSNLIIRNVTNNKALEIGVIVHLWTESSKFELDFVNVWNCSIESTPRVQEMHLIWGHLLAEYVELFFE